MMGGGFHVGKALGADTPTQAGWCAASYPFVFSASMILNRI